MSAVRPLRLWTMVFISVTIGLVCECEARPAVYVSILSNRAHVGDNITVQCRISGVADLEPRVRWVRSAVGDSGRSKEQIVADGVQVVRPYSSLGRYFPDLTVLGEVTLYLVTIYWLRHEDSGRIRCVLPDVRYYNDDADSVVLQVFKRPRHLFFAGYKHATEITVTEDNPVLLECVAQRVLPLPQFQIRVRNHSVSENLTPNATVNVHCRDPACGPVHFDLDARLTVRHLHVGHRHDGQYVTCSASLPHSNWTPNQTSLRLNVRYRPRFHCHRSHGALLHEYNVSVACKLRHNPEPSELYVTWHHGRPHRVDVGNSRPHDYRLSATSMAGEKETLVTFVIGRVALHDFHSYHFHSVNDVGKTSHAVRLIRRHRRPTTSTDGAMTSQHVTSPAYLPASATVSFMTSATSRMRVGLALVCWLVDLYSIDQLIQLLLSTPLVQCLKL